MSGGMMGAPVDLYGTAGVNTQQLLARLIGVLERLATAQERQATALERIEVHIHEARVHAGEIREPGRFA